MIFDRSHVVLYHPSLNTSFHGVEHSVSSPATPIHQFRGIKYAIVPARFRQSILYSSYPPVVDATKYGPICPQPNQRSLEEELIGIPDTDIPRQVLAQDEFGCLNLNITVPAHQASLSRIPVMVWVHGGGNHGCGSSWVYDGGPLVATSIRLGKPIILVTFNYRLGFFGCAASPKIAEDNRAASEQGVGNYGLRDQRRALEWVNQNIAGFGGDPSNVTFFGTGSGAADIIGHLYSNPNKVTPLFARAIVQSPIIEHNVPDVATAGWLLSRALCTLRVSTLDQLRDVRAEALAEVHCPIRAVDDGFFFRVGWRESLFPAAETEDIDIPVRPSIAALRLGARKGTSKSRSPHPQGRTAPPAISGLQPLIIGDSACDSDLWSTQASSWVASGVVRRLRAICQSLNKATALLNAYEIAPHTTYELSERVLELVQDARIAWPTECVVQAAKKSGRHVWRYVFDQEGPARGVPHHAADLIYLFDNVPLPLSPAPSPISFEADEPLPSLPSSESSTGDVADMMSHKRTLDDIGMMDEDEFDYGHRFSRPNGGWPHPVVDEWSYGRVRDAIQSRWITFAWGERPWDNSRGKIFVFGPEGETGERCAGVFEGRRRRKLWEDVLRPLGMALVHKVGHELSNGPVPGSR